MQPIKYLRLSNRLINTQFIKQIEIHPNASYIELTGNPTFTGYSLFGVGFVHGFNCPNNISIYRDQNKEDYYKIVEYMRNA